jgi:hypothetical protein
MYFWHQAQTVTISDLVLGEDAPTQQAASAGS